MPPLPIRAEILKERELSYDESHGHHPMICKNCGSEWSVEEFSLVCPHCETDNRLPKEEIDRKIDEASHAIIAKKYTEAVTLLQEAAEQGDPHAQFQLASLLLEGKGVKASAPKAAVYLKTAARHGDNEASLLLAKVLGKMSVPEDTCLFWVYVSAVQGNAKASHQIAKKYEKGDGLSPSLPRALGWYMRASLGGEEEATVDLVRYYAEDGTDLSKAHARFFLEKVRGRRLLTGHYQRKLGKGESVAPKSDKLLFGEELCELGKQAEDLEEFEIALFLFREAEERKSAEAIYRIGLCFEKGTGLKKDYAQAAICYKRAAEAGYSPAMTQLGLLLRDKNTGSAAPQNTLEWLQKAAEAGEPDAEYALGCAYFDGGVAERSLRAARYWFAKAAAHGHAEAKERSEQLAAAMEEVYEKGLSAKEAGAQEDAFRLFSIAADMGHRDARFQLGLCYQMGAGVRRNAKKAVELYTLAVKAGNMEAVFYLGNCYMQGDGVRCNYRDAATLLQKAEQAGFSAATALLSKMEKRRQEKAARKLYSISSVIYRRGDVDGAIRFRVLSAGKGDAKAMFLLGCHYEFGDGLPYDHLAADNWFRKATAAGFQVGAARLKNGFAKEHKRRITPKRKFK